MFLLDFEIFLWKLLLGEKFINQNSQPRTETAFKGIVMQKRVNSTEIAFKFENVKNVSGNENFIF